MFWLRYVAKTPRLIRPTNLLLANTVRALTRPHPLGHVNLIPLDQLLVYRPGTSVGAIAGRRAPVRELLSAVLQTAGADPRGGESKKVVSPTGHTL